MTAAEYLDRVEAAAEAVTDGPWVARESGAFSGGGTVYEPRGYPLPGCMHCGENDAIFEMYDAEFIALSRDAMPRMAAALRAVLSLCDANAEADAGGLREWGEVSIVQVRRTITAALGGAS